MKKAKQFVGLTLMLIFPICVIYFLRTFGENKFEIPVYHQNAAELPTEKCRFPEGQHYIPDFSLLSHKNEAISNSYFDDQITVVNFFFTNCTTICPIMSSELMRVQGNFYDNHKVKVLSVTIDPENDNPEVLANYARLAGAHENQWDFATGSKEGINELMRCGFVLPAQEDKIPASDYVPGDNFVLVDSQRRIRGYYAGTDRSEVDRLIVEMKILLDEENF